MNNANVVKQTDDYRSPLMLGVAASVIVLTINAAMGGGVAPRWAYVNFSILSFAPLAVAAFRLRRAPKPKKFGGFMWLALGFVSAAFQLGVGLNM